MILVVITFLNQWMTKAPLQRANAATLRGVILLSLPASVGLVMLRQPVVAMLFERGSHAELLARGGRYAGMWALQQQERDEAAA